MSLTIPDHILQSAHISETELRQEIAILLFQQERLTLGQASHYANLDQLAFQNLLAHRHIPLHYDIVELHQDLQSLQANNWQ